MTCHQECFFSCCVGTPPGPWWAPLLSCRPNSSQSSSAFLPRGWGAEGSAGGLLNVVMSAFPRCRLHRDHCEASTGENGGSAKKGIFDDSFTRDSRRRCGTFRGASRLEAVPHPRFREQVPGTRRIRLQLAAQLAHVHAQVVGLVVIA